MGILQSNMKIGILGGGQLAMMMIQMSTKHNIDFIVIDPNENPPASKYAKCIKSTFTDKSSLDTLIKECDVVTIDFENVNLALEDHYNYKSYGVQTVWNIITFQIWYKNFMRSLN